MPRATVQVSFELPPGMPADHAAEYLKRVTRTWLRNYDWLAPKAWLRNHELRVEVIEEPKDDGYDAEAHASMYP
jgi:hypothetical protein